MAHHLIHKQDLEYYIKCLAAQRQCTVDQVDRVKAHLELIFHKAKCMREIEQYRVAAAAAAAVEKQQHQQHQVYYCSICCKGFNSRTNRNRHTRTVLCANKGKYKIFICKVCNKQFAHRCSRDRHQRSVHT